MFTARVYLFLAVLFGFAMMVLESPLESAFLRASVTCICIYLIIKEFSNGKWH